jgi:hypothetical protein
VKIFEIISVPQPEGFTTHGKAQITILS